MRLLISGSWVRAPRWAILFILFSFLSFHVYFSIFTLLFFLFITYLLNYVFYFASMIKHDKRFYVFPKFQGLFFGLLMWTSGDSSVIELDSGWFFPLNWIISFPYVFRSSTVGIPFALFVSKTFIQTIEKNLQTNKKSNSF